MIRLAKLATGATALAMLAGCVEETVTTGPSLTAAAEAACLARAQDSSVRGPYVISAEYSEANTLVTVGGSQGDRYRCLSSNSGVIAEFSLL